MSPLTSVNMYNVIHKNSAVNSKWRDVLTLTVILVNNIKNKSITKLISPKVISYSKYTPSYNIDDVSVNALQTIKSVSANNIGKIRSWVSNEVSDNSGTLRLNI